MINKFLIVFLLLSTQASANLSSANVISEKSDLASFIDTKNPGEKLAAPLSRSTQALTESKILFDQLSVNEILSDFDKFTTNQTKSLRTPTPPQARYDTIFLKNPFKITTGGGAVGVDWEDIFIVLAQALKDTLKKIPSHFLNNMSGFPDTRNPKAIFNYIFDTTTTLICQAQGTATQSAESITWWKFAKTKWEDLTTEASSDDGASGTQINDMCGALTAKDEVEQTQKSSINKSADKKATADVEGKAIEGQFSKFQTCKNKYEDYKAYLFKELNQIDLLAKGSGIKRIQSTCEVIQRERTTKKLWEYEDAYQSKSFSIPSLFTLSNDNRDIFKTSNGLITTITPTDDDSDDAIPQLSVNRTEIYKRIINLPGSLTRYNPQHNPNITTHKIPQIIGIRYANLITSCIDSDSTRKDNEDIEAGYAPNADNVFCDALNSSNQFPYKFKYSGVSDPGINKSLINKVKEKSSFCRSTLFNKDNKDFIKNTIGFVSGLYSEYSYPTQLEMEIAINEVILNDYCQDKYSQDIEKLKVYMDDNLSKITTEAIDLPEMRLLNAYTRWLQKELHMPVPISDQNNQIVRTICQKSKSQPTYFVASSTNASDTLANIAEVTATNLSELKLQVAQPTQNIIIEGFSSYHKYDLSMKCEDTILQSGDTCDVNKIKCGINFTDTTTRKDKLYDNPSHKKQWGDYDIYEEKKKNDKDKVPASYKDFEDMDTKILKAQIKEVIHQNESLTRNASLLIIRQIKVIYMEILNSLIL
jgi:hypothetical protein